MAEADHRQSIKREIEDFAEALEDAVFVHVLDIMGRCKEYQQSCYTKTL